MADFAYTFGQRLLMEMLNGNTAYSGGTLKFRLFMASSVIGDSYDYDTIADVVAAGALDEMDGANYPLGGLAIPTPLVDEITPSLASGYAQIRASSVPTFTALGAGTRALSHLVLVYDLNNDASAATTYLVYHWDLTQDATGADYSLVFTGNAVIRCKD